jgi:hypothetical protein
MIAVTQGRPSRNRANRGLNEFNPFRIEEWILQRIETQIILIPLKTAKHPDGQANSPVKYPHAWDNARIFLPCF